MEHHRYLTLPCRAKSIPTPSSTKTFELDDCLLTDYDCRAFCKVTEGRFCGAFRGRYKENHEVFEVERTFARRYLFRSTPVGANSEASCSATPSFGTPASCV